MIHEKLSTFIPGIKTYISLLTFRKTIIALENGRYQDVFPKNDDFSMAMLVYHGVRCLTRKNKAFRKLFHPSVTIYLTPSFRYFVFGENLMFGLIQRAQIAVGSYFHPPKCHIKTGKSHGFLHFRNLLFQLSMASVEDVKFQECNLLEKKNKRWKRWRFSKGDPSFFRFKLFLISWEPKGTPQMPSPPRNKALLRDYYPLVSHVKMPPLKTNMTGWKITIINRGWYSFMVLVKL